MQHNFSNSRTSFERLIRKIGAEKYLRRVDIVGYVSLDIEAVTAGSLTPRLVEPTAPVTAALTDKIYVIYPINGGSINFANKAQLGLQLLKLLEPAELDELATRI